VHVTPNQVEECKAAPVVVVASDASNHVVKDYTGTVHFTSTDTSTNTTLPADYTFTASDHGVHVFQATFATTGPQTITATDTKTKTGTASCSVNVKPPAVANPFE